MAMSSRNMRLTPEEREKAVWISKTLQWVLSQYGSETPKNIEKQAVQKLNSIEGFDVDYLKIVDRHTLEEVEEWTELEDLIVCTAARLGKIRLIDNMLFKLGKDFD